MLRTCPGGSLSRRFQACALLLVLAGASPASAQTVEAVGSRALGMGGAFVAVANDSSATWWNPGALANGPYMDIALARAVTDSSQRAPASRDWATWFALGTPAVGLSYYRLRLTEIAGTGSTVAEGPVREDGLGVVPLRSLSARQFGVTLVQTLMTGVHVGTTLKYVYGSVRTGFGASGQSASDLLSQGKDLEGGDGNWGIDADIGVLAVGGPVRVGGLVRNLREIEFDAPVGPPMRLERQVRLGVAYDGAAVDSVPLVLSLDADVVRYATATGDRRVVALGAEQWLFSKRLALRAGGRINTVGGEDRAATGGVSVALRSGLFVDGHIVRGGTADDRGWGIAARVSF
jgi:hypothetical protein